MRRDGSSPPVFGQTHAWRRRRGLHGWRRGVVCDGHRGAPASRYDGPRSDQYCRDARADAAILVVERAVSRGGACAGRISTGRTSTRTKSAATRRHPRGHRPRASILSTCATPRRFWWQPARQSFPARAISSAMRRRWASVSTRGTQTCRSRRWRRRFNSACGTSIASVVTIRQRGNQSPSKSWPGSRVLAITWRCTSWQHAPRVSIRSATGRRR